MENTNPTIFEKKMTDLTVSEDMKITIGVTVITAIIPVAVGLSVAGLTSVVKKYKMRKAGKLAIVTAKEN